MPTLGKNFAIQRNEISCGSCLNGGQRTKEARTYYKPEGEDGDAPGTGVPCGGIMVDVDFPRRNTPLDGPAGRGEESQSSATPGKGSLT